VSPQTSLADGATTPKILSTTSSPSTSRAWPCVQKALPLIADGAAGMPGGRNITPEEVAAAVTFLASGDASGINGCDLQVDGGLTQI